MVANATGTIGTTAIPDLAASPNDRKLRQLVLTLVAQLAEAQFARADQPQVDRIWREVAALEVDPERIIRLLYGGHHVNDRQALAAMDRTWAPEAARPTGAAGLRRQTGPSWLRRPWPAAGRRSAPPAGSPARH